MSKALMLFMPCVPSKDLILAMRDRYGSGRIDVFFVESKLMYGHIVNPDLFVEKMHSGTARRVPETREVIELIGEFFIARSG